MRILERLTILTTENSTAEDEKYLREKYAPYCKKVGLSLLNIYQDIPKYEELLKEAEQLHLVVSKSLPFLEFSKKELDTAEFLVIHPGFEITDFFGGGDLDTFFAPKCSTCQMYVHQHTDIKVRKKDLTANRDFILSCEFQLLVSPRLKEILEEEQCTGVAFRPVYTPKVEEPVLYQLVITNVLPPLPATNDLDTAIALGNKKLDCPDCGYKSYHGKIRELYHYPSSIQSVSADFNRSYENFGIFKIPIPLIIVSQRVRQIFLKHKIKRARFEPILLVDET